MVRKEEIYAQELFKDLKQEFNSHAFIVNIEGEGVYWICEVKRQDKKCKISCAYTNRTDIDYKGAEYILYYCDLNTSIAEGSTFDKLEAIASVKDWLGKSDLATMYAKHAFIDKDKRNLEVIQQEIIAYYPEIVISVKINITSYHILMLSSNRQIEICYFSYEENPTFIFYWAEVRVFDVKNIKLGAVLPLIIHWIYHFTMPYVLQKEFPQFEFGKLVFYFEQGKGLEGQFIQSWDWVEEFYQSLDLPIKNTIIELIQEMRKRGFDKTLKATKSHYDLIISNEKHSSIMFIFYEIVSAQKARIFFNQYKDSFTPEENKEFQDMIKIGNSNFIKMILSYNDKRDETISEIKYTPQIESLLQGLEKEEID